MTKLPQNISNCVLSQILYTHQINTTSMLALKYLLMRTMNETITYNCRKLKRSGLIDDCYSQNNVFHIKANETARPIKVFNLDKSFAVFPDHFPNNNENDLMMCQQAQIVSCNHLINVIIRIVLNKRLVCYLPSWLEKILFCLAVSRTLLQVLCFFYCF